jgi:dipeptidyl-peptidase 4
MIKNWRSMGAKGICGFLLLSCIPSMAGAADEALYLRLLDLRGALPSAHVVPQWRDDGTFQALLGPPGQGEWVVIDPQSGTRRSLRDAERTRGAAPEPGASGAELPSPDGRRFLGQENHNLHLRWAVDDRTEPLTLDGTAEQPWLSEEARWSPDGYRLVVQRRDFRGVHQVPIVHWLKPREEVEWVPMTKTGGRLPRTGLFVLDTLSRSTVTLDLGGETEAAAYFHIVGWTGDGAEVLFLRMERGFDRLRLMAADPQTGRSRVILEERSETFLWGLRFEFLWPQLFTPAGDGQHFLWLSERDGWSHLYLYDLQGKLHRRLITGEFPVREVVGVDAMAPDGWVYFTAQGDPKRPYDVHLYRAPLEAEGPSSGQRLTEAPGVHRVDLAPDHRSFLDYHSSPARPPRTEVWRLEAAGSRRVMVLAETDPAPLKAMGWQPPEEVTALAADGVTRLHGLLYKPFDFDPRQRYPVVDSIYNGPFATWVPRTFLDGVGLYAQALAQRGFVVLVVDGRGTPGRGKAFQDVVHGHFGDHEIADHAAVLRALAAERPYLDLDRVGIFGGSWGGYFTVRALLTAPELYRVGVALNPVSDLYDHEASAIEGYMGLPQENPQGYAAASNLALVGQMRGKLLVLHSTADQNATFSATMKLAHAFMTEGKLFDLVVLPEESHTPRGVGQEYWLEVQRRYLEEHLAPKPAGPVISEPPPTPAP